MAHKKLENIMLQNNRLAYLPVSIFATVMGMSGVAIAWQTAAPMLSVPSLVPNLLLGFTVLLLVVLLVLYGLKMLRHRDKLMAEWRNPVALSFFPTISISFLLLAIALLQHQPGLSHVLWLVGTGLHLLLTLLIINTWLHHQQFEIKHINPAWFIPAVGNVLVPVAGMPLGYTDVSWFFFSIGMLFWIILMTIVFNRVIFHQPLPDKLLPTLFILIAPPAVGFVSYLQLVGELDAFARVLYFAGLFLTLLLLTQAPRFARLPFFLSSWAYSFPLAAITIASLAMYKHSGKPGYYVIGLSLLVLVSALVAMLLLRTAAAIRKRGICQPEA